MIEKASRAAGVGRRSLGSLRQAGRRTSARDANDEGATGRRRHALRDERIGTRPALGVN
jgi:hypothetical protein